MMIYVMEGLDLSNKSKALARKAIVKAQKRVENFNRMLPQLSVLAVLDDEVADRFLEENIVCKAQDRFNDKIKEFERNALEVGVNPTPLVEHLVSSLFCDKGLVTIMAEECKKQ